MNQSVFIRKVLNIAKLVLFAVLFVLLLKGVSVWFFSEQSATEYKNERRDAYSFLNDEENSIQVLGVGNSDLYSGISPLDWWNAYGTTCTVCAAPKQTVQQSTQLAKRVFETQKPELVIIETDMLFPQKPREDAALKTDVMTDFFDRADPDYFENEIENNFSVFRFHNAWQKRADAPVYRYSTHGYKFSDVVYPMKSRRYMRRSKDVTPIANKLVEQLDALIKLCKENDAKVLLLELPSAKSWTYGRHNAVQKLADERKLQFVDMNLLYRQIGINMRSCYRDKGDHLTYEGAKAATLWLGNCVAARFGIESVRDDERLVCWDEDYQLFQEHVSYVREIAAEKDATHPYRGKTATADEAPAKADPLFTIPGASWWSEQMTTVPQATQKTKNK